MPKKVLIVDSSEAFALMLQDSIQREAGHEAVVCTQAGQARACLMQTAYDLGIIDMGLEEDPLDLVAGLRQMQPDLRLVLIPLMGEKLPEEAQELDIQGVLTKPFFVGDLASIIESALTAPVQVRPAPGRAPEPARDQAAPPRRAVPASHDEWAVIIGALHREVAAEAIVLVGPTGVVVCSGEIAGVHSDEMGRLLSHMAHVTSETLRALSRPGEETPQQGYCEGLRRRLYWLALGHDWLLACILTTEMPLGMLRYHMRQTAERLLPLIA